MRNTASIQVYGSAPMQTKYVGICLNGHGEKHRTSCDYTTFDRGKVCCQKCGNALFWQRNIGTARGRFKQKYSAKKYDRYRGRYS